MRTAPRRLVLPVLLAVGLAVPAAAGYVRGPAVWNGRTLPIHYQVNRATIPSTLEGTAGLDAVHQAFATWSAPACTRWSAVDDGDTAQSINIYDDQDTLLWLHRWPSELGAVGSVIGVTILMSHRTSGNLRDVDIAFNAQGFVWDQAGVASDQHVDTETIVLHEEGHFLGLDHSGRDSVMYFAYDGGTARDLRDDDRQGVCALYPADGTATCTADRDCETTQRCVAGTCVGADVVELGFGAQCSSRAACAAPLGCGCLAGDGCLCTRGCDASHACPAGPWACLQMPQGGVCWRAQGTPSGTVPRPRSRGLGERCAQGIDCASGACLGDLGGGWCTQLCTGDCGCPEGFRCAETSRAGFLACVRGPTTCTAWPDAGVDAGPPPGNPVPARGCAVVAGLTRPATGAGLALVLLASGVGRRWRRRS